MVLFFGGNSNQVLAVHVKGQLSDEDIQKLEWLFSNAKLLDVGNLEGFFVGPRREMITPWSTNAVEITQNMGISGILRIEELFGVESAEATFDPMLQKMYYGIDQTLFDINKKPDEIVYIEDVSAYNQKEGLALSTDEISYLNDLSKRLGRKLTDSEVFGFSQVNSEHCRHKIFNGIFIIDGEEKQSSLFQLIKRTSKENPNYLISAYKDNVAFIQGPVASQFAPKTQDKPDLFTEKEIETVISLKAETHNFPTTVEPFNGAATGTGGEIRDRLAGGKGSLPLAGTAVYMTSYPRPDGGRDWEKNIPERPWLYQTPEQILVKASNGASDFGNKFGQPLICGSVLTFEHFENQKKFAFDKVIMLAGGIGFARKSDSLKDDPSKGDKVVVLGGDNYRIGMGGGAVSSVATGEYDNSIELNAVQRSNPEMQKRAMNAIRAMVERDENPIVSIHDHGAGGHLNCLSELVETTGGTIHLDKLPVGDPTLSAREIVGNESQERMGLVLNEKDIEDLKRVAERERSPMYVVGETTGDMHLKFEDSKGNAPINWQLADMFGNPPKTIMNDETVEDNFSGLNYDVSQIEQYIKDVLQLEAVACKDWLTNKVDRSVTGRVAKQQCAGEIQLPLNNVGVTSIDYRGIEGVATSIGHAPAPALIDPAAGSVLSVAEALTNLVWAPLTHGLKGVSLSANWMWPCKNKGEDARLYKAVEALSDFTTDLGINVPTGKDSLSMTQKYKDGDQVFSPGTVIVSSVGEVSDIRKVVEPVLVRNSDTKLLHVDLSFDGLKLGGSSFAQILNQLGNETPTVTDVEYFSQGFAAIQELIKNGLILAGHDISAGGLVTALLEMCFANTSYGIKADLSVFEEEDVVKILFSENPGVIIQVEDEKAVASILEKYEIEYTLIGKPIKDRNLIIEGKGDNISINIDEMRDLWYKTSYLLDRKQSGAEQAAARFENYKLQPLSFKIDKEFKGSLNSLKLDALPESGKRNAKAAIIREKGVNGDREMAYSLYLAGFDVVDVHMTDLITGRETLADIDFIVFVGGFSNSDVLGSAKGWAGAFLYNDAAKKSLNAFYERENTLSLGVCNGCQLMVELGLVYPEHEQKPKMLHNESHKFESGFVNMVIPDNNSVMFNSLSGSRLGIWIAHGEGKFKLPMDKSAYNVIGYYGYEGYPANPNGSDYNVAGICSANGRHLAMMPHLERAVFPWQWAHYPSNRKNDEVTPWLEAFVNARKWVESKK
ncbi:phosphoribosylformylglycinamidine synthase [Alkalitalea saponilacus]|uniref:Phosphoribosylformylglycinamidine synthase n=1 Tax=Alkalitalea saponilacus TaxID=889453 RepID=A0A1T5HTC8_9BACT|nr:phosphoribosylformylglycinamidine synthase [Alkalitalea saponilacus]ASB50210.1 phosphoribosylformylglycinamidine synthase [Alkalitalea saponilacus]SKC23937.1 phosphoribosylformylglycinamidine synthase [Alkalitalea saponilacus]